MSGACKKKRIAALLAVLVLAMLLRAFNVGHTLSYDEAWNVNSIVDVATGQTGDLFYGNFFRHPPLYTGLGVTFAVSFQGWSGNPGAFGSPDPRLTGSVRYWLATFMQVMSILFSLGLITVIFLCGADWFNDRVGLAAAFLFACMPAARAYDSLAKQESLTLLLGMLFLLLFFRGKYALGGFFLGLAFLSKEIAVFIPLALFVFLMAVWRRTAFKGFAVSAGVAALVAFWWYLFFSEGTGEFARFFLGRSVESLNWGRPWYEYLIRLPRDVGWVALVLTVAGLLVTARQWRIFGFRAREGPLRPRHMAMFLLVWWVCCYLALSISLGKPPWMVYSALPAVALLAGVGLLGLWDAMKRPASRAAVAAVSLALAVGLSAPVSFSDFFLRADRTYARGVTYREAAEYINDRVDGRGRVMVRENDINPILSFYLGSYWPGGVSYVESGAPRGRRPLMLLLPRGFGPGRVERSLEEWMPDFLIMRPGFDFTGEGDVAVRLAALSPPIDIKGLWVFNAVELCRGLKTVRQRPQGD